MKDPERLLDGDGTEFERALLGAIAAERPSRDLQRKMRLGLGLVGVGAVAKSASASFQKVALAGMVVAGLVTGGAVVAKHELSKRPEETARVAMSARAPVVAPVEAKPTATEPIPTTLPEVRKSEERPKSAAVLSKAQVPDIREEIRLLDQARSAVKGGESSQALRLLSKYDQRFPQGQFRQEVQVLRIEALKQNGESERAAALAKKFLAEHPKSPHVERVENARQK
jgi:hypothetical protein